eukprot:TRINITY_DN12557_c0_g1_i1.p1 TRINITY_DN12557_c0_g1~~TRINITY_DN12557_c0_g1_i1.p1  ORF type:complete len:563 (-),score=117.74 TRINITY_DN12557_c0_g1_i1:54-1742(-)
MDPPSLVQDQQRPWTAVGSSPCPSPAPEAAAVAAGLLSSAARREWSPMREGSGARREWSPMREGEMRILPHVLSPGPRSAKGARLARMFANPDRYADCVVVVGHGEAQRSVRVNRTLLARCSSKLGKLLFQGDSAAAEVKLPQFSAEAFQQLLHCAHDMQPHVYEGNFVEVFKLAADFDVEDLLEALGNWMAEALVSPCLALRAIDAARLHGLGLQTADSSSNGQDVPTARQNLGLSAPSTPDQTQEELTEFLQRCLLTAAQHCEVLLRAGAFCGGTERHQAADPGEDGGRRSAPETIAALLQHSCLSCDEEKLWLELVKWSEGQGCDTLRSLAPYMRFNVMSSEFFVDRVVPSGVLQPDEVVELLGSRATGRPAPRFPHASDQRAAAVPGSTCSSAFPWQEALASGTRRDAMGTAMVNRSNALAAARASRDKEMYTAQDVEDVVLEDDRPGSPRSSASKGHSSAMPPRPGSGGRPARGSGPCLPVGDGQASVSSSTPSRHRGSVGSSTPTRPAWNPHMSVPGERDRSSVGGSGALTPSGGISSRRSSAKPRHGVVGGGSAS